MTSRVVLAVVFLSAAASVSGQPAARWWSHVALLASDAMKGRDTGTAEHRQAAEYVADQFKRAGLEPGGTKGYFQPVTFRSRRINEEQSSLALVRSGATEPVVLGDEATFSMRIEPAPSVDAPAHYQSTRWDYLKKTGAVGVIAIQNPKGQDIPWDRSKLSRFMPAVAIADSSLDETLDRKSVV